MNEYDILDARQRYEHHPVLGRATATLVNLQNWANANSDGWAYWPKPARAAKGLMALIERQRQVDRSYHDVGQSVTEDEYRKALAPIKAFRTRHGADFEVVA